MAGKTVIVIDPDLTNASIIKKSIVAFDPSVDVALFNSYKEVQPLLLSTKVDCIIIDSTLMHEISSEDAGDTVSGLSDPSRLMITGYPADLSALPGIFQNGYSLIQKPLDGISLSHTLKRIIGEANTDIVQQVNLDSAQFYFCQGVVRKLKNHLGARMVLLSDNVGRILVTAGDTPTTSHDLICSLLGGSIASAIEASKTLEDQSIVHLVFREGEKTDLYAINVGNSLLLAIMVSKSDGYSRMGTTWHFGRQCSIQLNRYFTVTNSLSEDSMLLKSSIAEITNELDKLFTF
jgi:hypothetical protein